MNNFDFKSMLEEDIAATGNVILKGKVDITTLTIDDKLTNLAVLLAYKKLLDKMFSDKIKVFEDLIDEADFKGTYNIGNHKIIFKVKEDVSVKITGATREKLRSDYNIADSIITKEEKVMYTLKKDKLYEAYLAQIPEVLDAIRDGKLSTPTIVKTKISDVE